jgi:4-aminobutyrate aminotransferase
MINDGGSAMETELQYLSPVWSRVTDLMIVRGEGVYLYDDSGKRYLDFTSGIGVTNTGHCHPKVVEAIRRQAGELIFGQLNIVYHRPVLELIGELRQVVPRELDRFFFGNSGAEAVEGAVKLAKQATGRPNVIVFQGSFHGRTHLTMAMTTSKTVYRTLYQPLVAGIFVAPYPYAYYYGWDEAAVMDFAVRELERLLKSQSAPQETACVVVEPVLGEGGYVVPPPGFLRALRRICDEEGILLVADEIQSGFGRTGRYFAVEHDGIIPDIMTMAKGIASGVPISCIAYRRALGERWLTGSHGGTYGGNPLACAAAAASVRVLREERLHENARARGKQLLEGLTQLQKRFPRIGDVRGLGLMAATEFGRSGQPDEGSAKAVIKAAAQRGLLLLSCGTFGNVVRWIPPLVVTESQIAEGLSIFARALETL